MCIYKYEGYIYTFKAGLAAWVWLMEITHAYSGEVLQPSKAVTDEEKVVFTSQVGVVTLYEPVFIVRR